jgi:hypothetical protein
MGRHRNSGLDGAVIYLSDHGQRLYDDERGQKGHGFGDLNAYDAEIPLLAWISERYDAREPNRHRAIEANAVEPVSAADLATAMLDLADIEVDGLNLSRSFFGPHYVARPRWVLATDGRRVDYDASLAPVAPVRSSEVPPGRRGSAAPACATSAGNVPC